MQNLSPARRNRLILVVSALLIALAVLWVARNALVPYIFALVLAYLVLPLVNLLDGLLKRLLPRFRFTRPIAIVAVYLLMIGGFVLFVSLVIPVLAEQFNVLWTSREDLATAVKGLTGQFLTWYEQAVPADIQVQVTTLLRQASGTVAKAVQTGVTRTLGVVTGTFSFVLGFAVIPFWLFYVLNDQAKVTRGVVSLMPARVRTDLLNLIRIVDSIMSAYLRGQLLLCLFIGVMATLGLTVLGVRFPVVLGLIAGVFEVLPFIGPFIGLVPAVIVATIQSPLLGLWTLILFLGIQQIENLFLVPRISGKAVELHPAVIMVVLVLGSQIAGFWGLLLAVPLTAVVRDIFKYLYLRLQDEPMSPKAAMLALGRTPLQLDV